MCLACFPFQADPSGSTANLLSQKSTNLVEQVFNSSLFRHKDSSLTGGLTSGKIIDPRLAEGRGRPIWTVDDREARVTPFDLQVRFGDFERDHLKKNQRKCYYIPFPAMSLIQSLWLQFVLVFI